MIKTPVVHAYNSFIRDSDRSILSNDAEMAEVCRRVNVHDALVAALEKIRDFNCEHDLGDLQQFIKATVEQALTDSKGDTR